jgi:hypothetical protein
MNGDSGIAEGSATSSRQLGTMLFDRPRLSFLLHLSSPYARARSSIVTSGGLVRGGDSLGRRKLHLLTRLRAPYRPPHLVQLR